MYKGNPYWEVRGGDHHMGRRPCCSKDEGLNRGAWTAHEDKVLTDYITIHGEGRWRDLPKNAGLNRCGKSCRLRWLNYLKPDIKRGNITQEEEELIVRLHKLLGNRWSLIAGRLPARTDNEIKNYWNTTLSKKLNGTWVQKHPKKYGGKKRRRKNRSSNSKKTNKKSDNGTLQTEAPLTQRMDLQGEKEKKKKNSNNTNRKMKQNPKTKTVSIEAPLTRTVDPQVVRPKASRCNKVILSLESNQDEQKNVYTTAPLEHLIRSGDCVTDNSTIQSEHIHDGMSPFMYTPGQVNPPDDHIKIDLNQGDLDLPDINSSFFEFFEFQNGEEEECNGKSLSSSTEQTLLYHDELLEDLFGP